MFFEKQDIKTKRKTKKNQVLSVLGTNSDIKQKQGDSSSIEEGMNLEAIKSNICWQFTNRVGHFCV